jgi:intracellular multiplication protein IcmL
MMKKNKSDGNEMKSKVEKAGLNANDKKRKKSETVDPIEVVVVRNAFYSDQHKSSFLMFMVVVLINLFLGLGILYVAGHPPAPQYFPATNDYKLIELHPLSDPTVSDKFVTQWASLAAQRAYNLDYVHWQSQMAESSADFTDSGWSDFLTSLKSSGNLRSLLDLHLVSIAKVTGSPQITAQMVVGGRYAWKITVPMEVIYKGDKEITQTMQLTLIVVRAPAANYPSRVAINNYIADTQG